MTKLTVGAYHDNPKATELAQYILGQHPHLYDSFMVGAPDYSSMSEHEQRAIYHKEYLRFESLRLKEICVDAPVDMMALYYPTDVLKVDVFPYCTIEPEEDRGTRIKDADVTFQRTSNSGPVKVADFYINYRDEFIVSTDEPDDDDVYTFVFDETDELISDQYTQSEIIRSAIELKLTEMSDRLCGQLGSSTDVAAAFKSISDRLNPKETR